MFKQRLNFKGGSQVPVLRGYFHVLAAALTLVTLPLVLVLLPTAQARAAVCLALLQKAFLYYISGLGHTTEFASKDLHDRVFTLDHSNIFLALAADLSSILFCQKTTVSHLWPLLLVWVGGFAVVANFMFLGKTSRKPVFYSLVCMMACLMLNVTARMTLSSSQIFKITMIAVFGMGGATCWALEAPNPIPGILGFHEIHHICSLTAHVLHMFLLVDCCT